MNSKIRFHLIGADPEWAAARFNELAIPTVIPAHKVLGQSQRRGILSSYIGTDGHPETGEFRPPPSRNVKRLLYNIAKAVHLTDLLLASREQREKLVAWPMVDTLSLGAHIHLSWWVPQGTTWSPQMAVYALSAALVPLESWVQPLGPRMQRNQRYGHATDIRVVDHPEISRAGWYYAHYEYRLPSTWLIHPTVAYAYLGLAKLVALNAPDRWVVPSTLRSYVSYVELRAWLGQSWPKLRHSSDLRPLLSMLDQLQRMRDSLWTPGCTVNTAAWRELLLTPDGLPTPETVYNEDDPEVDTPDQLHDPDDETEAEEEEEEEEEEEARDDETYRDRPF